MGVRASSLDIEAGFKPTGLFKRRWHIWIFIRFWGAKVRRHFEDVFIGLAAHVCNHI